MCVSGDTLSLTQSVLSRGCLGRRCSDTDARGDTSAVSQKKTSRDSCGCLGGPAGRGSAGGQSRHSCTTPHSRAQHTLPCAEPVHISSSALEPFTFVCSSQIWFLVLVIITLCPFFSLSKNKNNEFTKKQKQKKKQVYDCKIIIKFKIYILINSMSKIILKSFCRRKTKLHDFMFLAVFCFSKCFIFSAFDFFHLQD